MSELIQSLTPSLFWDVERETIDDVKHRRFVIGRVLERGRMADWQRVKKHYGIPVVVREAQQMRSLDPKAVAFVSCIAGVPKESFRCYTLKPSHQKHWAY